MHQMRSSVAALAVLAVHASGSPVPGMHHVCAACAAVANELERQMHAEWAQLNITPADVKRTLAADAVKRQACGEAVESLLKQICDSVREYAVGTSTNGEVFYQKVRDVNEIIVTGSLVISSHRHEELHEYCTRLMHAHEDRLAQLMADGTEDLIADLCIHTVGECTPELIARIPTEGLPQHPRRSS